MKTNNFSGVTILSDDNGPELERPVGDDEVRRVFDCEAPDGWETMGMYEQLYGGVVSILARERARADRLKKHMDVYYKTLCAMSEDLMFLRDDPCALQGQRLSEVAKEKIRILEAERAMWNRSVDMRELFNSHGVLPKSILQGEEYPDAPYNLLKDVSAIVNLLRARVDKAEKERDELLRIKHDEGGS